MTLTKSATIRFFRIHGSKYTAIEIAETIFTLLKGELKLKRTIVKIDEEKCNGCGACAAACQEGAIAMIDGKAKLIRDDYCDGLGNCLPACPAGRHQL